MEDKERNGGEAEVRVEPSAVKSCGERDSRNALRDRPPSDRWHRHGAGDLAEEAAQTDLEL